MTGTIQQYIRLSVDILAGEISTFYILTVTLDELFSPGMLTRPGKSEVEVEAEARDVA